MIPNELMDEFSQCSENFCNYINSLHATIEDLLQKVTIYEARANMNSSNSSKPPSTDGYKKEIKNNRVKSGLKSGGQPGHKGSTLEKVPNPNEVIEHKIPTTCDCGSDMNQEDFIKKTRQVFDIPKLEVIVTEHVTYESTCSICGKVHTSQFPPNVKQPTQYGENFQSLVCYLNMYQLIPQARTAEAIEHITGKSISQGTVVNISKRVSKALEEPVNIIKQKIIDSDVVHFDETGIRSQGKTHWLHVAATDTLTHYEVHEKRGKEATDDIGILPVFNGISVHDHWMTYYLYKNCTHADCNAHHIRNLKGIHENYNQDWARNMIYLLVELKKRVQTLKEQNYCAMQKKESDEWLDKYHSIISYGIEEDGLKSPVILNKKGKPKNSKARQLLNKLQTYDIETLAFMYDFNVPFDNNLAERDLRMQKLREKISGCFRGAEGKNYFSKIRSYLSTARKNKVDMFSAIKKAVIGNPYIPGD